MTVFKRALYFLWYFGHFKVPLIGYLSPSLIQLDENRVVLKIPLSRRSRNHLNSMYFGALFIGADLAGGLHAYYYSKKLKLPISLAFKTAEAQFLKRAESDVYFVGEMGEEVLTMMQESLQEHKRVNKMMHIKAMTHYPENPELVAEFKLELSIKVSQKNAL